MKFSTSSHQESVGAMVSCTRNETLVSSSLNNPFPQVAGIVGIFRRGRRRGCVHGKVIWTIGSSIVTRGSATD